MLSDYFKSVIDQDDASVVICNNENEIIYMNPSAIKNYQNRGGEKLLGKSIFDCHVDESNKKILMVTKWFLKSVDNNKIFTYHNEKQNKDVYMIALRNEKKELIGYYEKHEYRNLEASRPFNMIKNDNR